MRKHTQRERHTQKSGNSVCSAFFMHCVASCVCFFLNAHTSYIYSRDSRCALYMFIYCLQHICTMYVVFVSQLVWRIRKSDYIARLFRVRFSTEKLTGKMHSMHTMYEARECAVVDVGLISFVVEVQLVIFKHKTKIIVSMDCICFEQRICGTHSKTPVILQQFNASMLCQIYEQFVTRLLTDGF